MVSVASATLWITQQLAIWAMLAQALAIVISLWRRRDPFEWQRSPIALNLGMMAVTGATIHVAFQGGPATLGLAHFAALTQGLQLIDARARRTEFLLVALALFQVLLASNLTDSVFFTPLLFAFLFSTAWTLLVHTLRSEAAEAGDHQSATHALTPALLRVTLVASAASVGLALVLFVLLPRLNSSIMQSSGFNPGFATSGFSDRVALGDIGKIRKDRTVVLRVETLQGKSPDPSNAYWRGLAFDHFDGTSWSVTPPTRLPVSGTAEFGVSFGQGPASANLVQRVVREPVEGGVLFEMGRLREVQGAVKRLERDVNGGLYAAEQNDDRLRYTVATAVPSWREEDLRNDVALPPNRDGARYLQLPELSEAVAALALQIVGDAKTDADRVRALERYLLRNGRYSDTPPALAEGDNRSALEAFLFEEMAAHCEYYASALVVLARSLGLPARLVNGFAGGRENRIGNFIELSRSDAHAWSEVHYERSGWVRYDATPPDLRRRAETSLPFDEQLRQFASAMEYWWFQRVVGFDRSDQVQAVKRAWLAWRGFTRTVAKTPTAPDTKRDRFQLGGTLREPLLGALALGATAILYIRVRQRHRRSNVPDYYARALRILSRRGLVRTPTEGAREFARSASHTLTPPASAAFSRLTEGYLRQRFGGFPEQDATSDLGELKREIGRRAPAPPPHGAP
jgi:transglutaminase-like putative cysteine protease